MTTKTDELIKELEIYIPRLEEVNKIGVTTMYPSFVLDLLQRCLSALKDAEARYAEAIKEGVQNRFLGVAEPYRLKNEDLARLRVQFEQEIREEIESRLRAK